jgi:pimeloyl-ACP methyl ester carboxylesterase
VDYDVRGFARASDGTRLFYGVRGRGPAVLLLDGIGCDGWAWNYIQPHLSQDHRVVHTHFRGHGRSGAPVDPAAIDISTLARDAIAVLEAAAIDRCVVIGHSMGTQVALEVYRRIPARIEGLVLICGSYGRITHTFHGNDLLSRALPQLIEQVRKNRGLARALWGRLPPQLAFRIAGWLGEIDGSSLDVRDFSQYVEHLSDIDLHLYLTMLQAAGDHSAEDLLSSVTAPTLVIAAERDTFTPVPIVRAVAERVAGATYVELAGASHAAPLERAQSISQALDAFFERLGWRDRRSSIV